MLEVNLDGLIGNYEEMTSISSELAEVIDGIYEASRMLSSLSGMEEVLDELQRKKQLLEGQRQVFLDMMQVLEKTEKIYADTENNIRNHAEYN